ncbi:uncharacterized protein [Argopecten irradians]|uniref:uncharacterized protein n=1 Tax=Argopecten irradians TaxID=31199 RepID=UPI00371E15C9
MSVGDYISLGNSPTDWYCFKCSLPPFTESFFNNSDSDVSDTSSIDCNYMQSTLPLHNSPHSEVISVHSVNTAEEHTDRNSSYDLKKVRETCKKNIVVCYLNINSFRNKSSEICSILYEGLCDILFIGESKLDDTFRQSCFDVPGYRCFRRDRNAHGGGLMAYVRADLPSRRRNDLELRDVESIVIECSIQKRKWAFIGTYKPPSMHDNDFMNDAVLSIDRVSTKYDNFMILGDLNFDCLNENKGKTLSDFCDMFDLTNKITEATCFMKDCIPSLVDVILTNCPSFCFKPINFNCGLSDCHNLIGIVIKGTAPCLPRVKSKFRSFKNFEQNVFNSDLSNVPFHVAYVFDDTEDVYWAHDKLLREVVDEHIPIKERKPRLNRPPFLNSNLRRAAFKKTMLRNRYNRMKTPANWEAYRKQRNYVVKLRRQSVRLYFQERCGGGPASKDFWPTIKPFLSNKCVNDQKIILEEDESIVSRQREPVYEGDVKNILSSMIVKKATGFDGISSKMLKAGSVAFTPVITSLFNHCVKFSHFPNALKKAQVLPIFKKNNPMDKSNFRPQLSGAVMGASLSCCELLRSGDDNTLSKIGDSFSHMKDCLEKESKVLIDWFNFNGMKANPEKFQAICFGKKTTNSIKSFNIDGLEIIQDNLVKIPRVNTSTYGKRSFRFAASQVWNSLPNECRQAENYSSFRRLLHTWDTQICSCTICAHHIG